MSKEIIERLVIERLEPGQQNVTVDGRWMLAEFSIHHVNDPAGCRVKGLVRDGIGIHNPGPSYWVITHLNTGLRIMNTYQGLNHAIDVGEAILAMADWTKGNSSGDFSPEVKKKVAALVSYEEGYEVEEDSNVQIN